MLAIYPKEAESFKTAEETKAELKRAVRPAEIGVGVSRLRRVGNAGVLLETTSSEAAARITRAVPPSLRVAEPRKRRPFVALRNVEGDPGLDAVLEAMHDQNFGDNPDWSLEKLKRSCRLAFKKSKRGDDRTTVVLEYEPGLRDMLVTKGRIFMGWDSVQVEDFISVTCCNRCQLRPVEGHTVPFSGELATSSSSSALDAMTRMRQHAARKFISIRQSTRLICNLFKSRLGGQTSS